MSTALIAVAILSGLILTFLPFVFKAGAEGRLRRGAGWYLDVSAPREGPLPAYRRPPRVELTGPRVLRVHLGAGLGDLGLAAVAWLLLDAPVVAFIVGVVGLALVGLAAEGWRTNHLLQSNPPDLAGHLIARAEAALKDAQVLRSRGEHDAARHNLEQAAAEIRRHAPGSGNPDEVMDRVRELKAAAQRP